MSTSNFGDAMKNVAFLIVAVIGMSLLGCAANQPTLRSVEEAGVEQMDLKDRTLEEMQVETRLQLSSFSTWFQELQAASRAMAADTSSAPVVDEGEMVEILPLVP